MNFFYERKIEHEEQCKQLVESGAFSKAIFHAKQAAKFAKSLAEQATGEVQNSYLEEEKQWLELAESLDDKQAIPTTLHGKNSGDGNSATQSEEGDSIWQVTEDLGVTFDDICGMEDAKQSLMQMLVYPVQNREISAKLKLSAGGGLLLYGPPGTGKTTLAKAAASELDAAFFYASGADIRSKWHGESEQHMRELFTAATSHPVSVIFLDDLDGMLPKRSDDNQVDNRLVVQFLSECGGFEQHDSILLLLGATNYPWNLDDAVFRTGRFDEKIYIGLPDDVARLGILNKHLDEVPCSQELDASALAKQLIGYTGSDIVGIINSAKRLCQARWIETKGELLLTSQDFEGALNRIPRSVDEKMLEEYRAFQRLRF